MSPAQDNQNPAPLIGVTCDVDDRDARARRGYINAIIQAGGAPLLLPPAPAETSDSALRALIESYLQTCSAIVLTGGDDPATEPFGVPTHPKAKRVHPDRQRFETALLAALDNPAYRRVPTLGVCLGMQMMALAAGGALNQHMPDDIPTHADHFDDRVHSIIANAESSALSADPARIGAPLGSVTSWHRQSVRVAGPLRIIARAPDGVIEAIDDPTRPFYLGVQWHPERSDDPSLGQGIFNRLIDAARDAQQPAN